MYKMNKIVINCALYFITKTSYHEETFMDNFRKVSNWKLFSLKKSFKRIID